MSGSQSRTVLIAEDQPVERRFLSRFVESWGYEPIVCGDGDRAWDLIEAGEAPDLMLLDWSMPGRDGVDICRSLRAKKQGHSPYVLMLTGRDEPEDLRVALEAGANDFVKKPFDPVELKARLRNGARTLELQEHLEQRVSELEDALARVQTLQGLLPICSYCKRVRSDENYWSQVESYVTEHSNMRFTHSICPTCYETHVEPELKAMEEELGSEMPANED